MAKVERERLFSFSGDSFVSKPSVGGKDYAPVIVGITWGHQKVHDGNMFAGGHVFEAVADGGTATLYLKPSGTNEIHIMPLVSHGGDAFGYFRENVTMSDPGSAITLQNNNRNSDNTSTVSLYYSPTYGTAAGSYGTAIAGGYMAGGEGNPAAVTGGGQRATNEWILNPNYGYAFDVVNKAGAAKTINIGMRFYECC